MTRNCCSSEKEPEDASLVASNKNANGTWFPHRVLFKNVEWSSKLLLIPVCAAIVIPLAAANVAVFATAWQDRLVIEGNLLYRLFGYETDTHYILSSRYHADRLRNQDFIEFNRGYMPPEAAPHWSQMPAPGKAHMIHSRNLYLWSAFATQHGVPWVIMGGTLLGYLRHGDVLPHAHDVHVVIDNDYKWIINEKLTDALPLDLRTKEISQSLSGWNGTRIVRDRHIRSKVGLELLGYNRRNQGSLVLWDGLELPASVGSPLHSTRKRTLGVTGINIPRNATEFLTVDLCREIRTDCNFGRYVPEWPEYTESDLE